MANRPAAGDAPSVEWLRECGTSIRAIEESAAGLAPTVQLLGLPALDGREWYRLLCEKLVPQLGADTYLVVAVVGGTNIGKSVIFNHIAETPLSASSPLASGTRNPVCVVPASFAESHELSAIFPEFELRPWTSANDALVDATDDRIYWRSVDGTPPNLLILDTPDIDSDVQVNWKRADRIRRVADVLIAVLTQQKYNDAAVKQYFRKAAEEGKLVLVIFNQCQLPEDDSYWPLWLDTFCRETGVSPWLVYVAPNDRRAAEEGRLPFFEKGASGCNNNGRASAADASSAPANLAHDLSRLKFAEIKLGTLSGALTHLMSDDAGLPAFLREVESRSGAFESAAKWLSSESVIKVRDWPTISNPLLVAEIRAWWRQRQHGLARRVHEFYDTLGRGIIYPFRLAGDKLRGPSISPLEQYRRTEWGAILSVIEEVYERLNWLSESAGQLLKPFLDRMLAGKSRSQLLEQLRVDHERVDFTQELSLTVNAEMRAFEEGSPELYRFYRQLTNVSAAVRPLTSVVLFTLGWGPAAHVLSPMLAPVVDLGTHSLVPIVADFATGAAAAAGGDAALASGANLLEARFRRLQTAFTTRRVDWLLARLKDQVFGTVPRELQTAAEVPGSEGYRKLAAATAQLAQQLADVTDSTPAPSSQVTR
ncbi:MAG TPA: GTPase domain-containing protein [Planctomycetaceae bacterium]|nr:GTPase domain-containing protein [Planctomycetaceae bacterium]